ncbi:MAG TPA: hypothetical protein VMV59_06820 [Candidatus Dormibacteraeota bacterium]|nr:hypothetical protein [Candidatus Dormibacteraeota bacterium]
MKQLLRVAILFFAAFFALFLVARLHGKNQSQSQTQTQSQASSDTGSMSQMDMPSMQREAAANPAARAANDDMSDMSGMHMDMNPHMFMTALRPTNAADQARAAQILATLRPAIAKYKDYHVALADGFKIFLPNVPQRHYHFTNRRYALEAQFAFNPARPTSLLYKKVPGGYELEGAMYTAPKRFTEDQLNERVPLSVARWHKHVNFCMPPKGTPPAQVNRKEFGLGGSISTEQACSAAGGRWFPEIFNWMVHVYPYESNPAKIWAH